jgi:hypothetical protein
VGENVSDFRKLEGNVSKEFPSSTGVSPVAKGGGKPG